MGVGGVKGVMKTLKGEDVTMKMLLDGKEDDVREVEIRNKQTNKETKKSIG